MQPARSVGNPFEHSGMQKLDEAVVQQFDPHFGGKNICGLRLSISGVVLVRGLENVANLRGILQHLIDSQRPLRVMPSMYSISK